MNARHAWSIAAALTLGILALGSGEDSSSDISEVPPTPVEAPAAATPTAATPAADPATAAPAGQCCCAFLESDAPTKQFLDKATCDRIGACGEDTAPCVAFQAALEKKKGTCCCESNERIQKVGEACGGECYEFYEEGDTEGSCIY